MSLKESITCVCSYIGANAYASNGKYKFMKDKGFATRLLVSALLMLALPLCLHATDVVVADANGNELTYSFDSADGPATFKGIKNYASDEAKKGRIIIADFITDADGNTHEVKYISGSVSNRSNIVSIVFGQNIVTTGGPEGTSSSAFDGCSKLTSVTLNAKLEILGTWTFLNCYAMESINLGDCVNLKTIMSSAIEDCDHVRELTIPASVETIERYAFYSIDSLRTVTFAAGSKLQSVAEYAFKDNGKLEHITLEACTQLKSIGDQAFYNCNELKSITFPASVETMAKNVLWYDNQIDTITFLAANIPADFYSSAKSLRTLNIGPGVKSIGNNAFSNIKTLVNLNIDPSVTDLVIGTNTFYDSDALETLSLPVGVKEIGNYAFQSIDSLKTVTFAAGSQLTTLVENAFRDNPRLETINLEACTQLTSIGNYALYNCPSLRTLTIPASVETFGSNILGYSNNIETMTFLAANVPNDFYRDRPKLTTLNIGPGVKSIGNNAFRNIKTLVNLNIDPSVTDLVIGTNTFYDSDALETLSLPVGVKEIGNYAFQSIDSLKTVTFAAGSQLTTLVENAFRDNPRLETINLEACTQLTSIGNYALYNCPSLRTLTIPASVETFGSNILGYSNNIETMTFLAANVPNDFYRDRPKLTTLNIGAGVKRIGNYAFRGSLSLKHLNISDDVDGLEIAEAAFSECDSLSNISLPAGVNKLGNYAFYSIDFLTSITFAEGSGITEIPYQCFYYCWSLETITLPDAVTTIGSNAFYYCKALRELTFGTGLTALPNDYYLFSYCDNLEKVTLPGTNYPFTRSVWLPGTVVLYVHPLLVETYKTTDYTKNYRIMAIGATNDYAVTTSAGGELQTKVPEDLAQYALSLTVTGPLNGTDIEYLHSSFPLLQVLDLKNASIVAGGDPYHEFDVSQNGTATPRTYRSTIATEDNVIGYAMFSNMPTLQSISLPKDATKMGQWAVSQNDTHNLKLTHIDIPSGLTEIGANAFRYTGISEITVPDGVTRLEEYTFYHCDKLQKATLPDGITFIGNSCFSEDTELLDVNIPASVETIDEYAFFNNQKRNTPLVFPATLKTIGHHAFRNNHRMKSITFCDGLESIGSCAFSDCYDVESITLPETVTKMADRAFQSCDSITQFTFPSAITEVPEAVLYHCDKLQKVTLAAGTTSIAGDAFENCPQLSDMNLAEQTSLTSVGNYAFFNTGFVDVTLPDSITSMGWCVFQNCKKLESINVPTGIDYVPYDYCEECNNLRSVQMHDGIRTIRHDAFLNCDSLVNIELNDQITSIEYQAFQRCQKLNLPKLPDALINLEYQAFHQTSSFTTLITIPAGVTFIGNDCFNGSAIKGVVMHNGLTLGTGVFSNNDSLRSVRLPQDLMTIPNYTFYKCGGLKHIDLPETLTSIGNNAFDLSGLESIELPESLNHIGNYAFASTQLTSFRMPDGFTGTDYGSYFLAYNYHLKSAHLGRNMDYTGYSDMSTFYRCDSLELLRLYTATPPKATSTGYFGFRSNCVLEVPEGSEENYRTSEYVWKDFKEIRGFFTGDELAEADFAVLKEIFEKLDSTKLAALWDLTDNHNPNGKWPGVSTAKRGSETSLIYGITDIDLSSRGLTGQLPESIFRLKDLKTLNLSYNHISGNVGEIVNAIADNKRAPLSDLNLRGNEITGDAYAIASALPQLTTLNLSYNQLTDVSQVIDKTTLTDLNLEMQFVDYTTKQPVAAAADVVQDITAGVPTAIELPTTFTYRHNNQDFNRAPRNLNRPYCYNIDYNWWDYTWELAENEGLWNIDSYDNRILRAPKGQIMAYSYDWQTVILRFTWKDGDVNADQTVDVTDLQSVVNFAFNERKYNGEFFNYSDADCNADNVINVSDIVGNVERILAYTPDDESRVHRLLKVQASVNSARNVLSIEGDELTLRNDDAVAAMQLTITGATQRDISVNRDISSRFTVAMRQTDEGLRLVIYSVAGLTLQPGDYTLLSKLPEGATVANVCLSDANAHYLDFGIDGAEATSINRIMDDGNYDIQVFDLNGRRLGSWESLPSGIYVIRSNGKQYKVKK